MKGIPAVLNAITDTVLAYRPRPKSKAARKRKRLKAKIGKEKKPDGNYESNAGG